jgi:hypothetical protein
MKWGTGEAAALERMKSLTQMELRTMGMRMDWSLDWAAFYRNELSHNPRNGSARGRIQLMDYAANLLGGA